MKIAILSLSLIIQLNAQSANFRDQLVKDKKFIFVKDQESNCSLFYPNQTVFSQPNQENNIALLNCDNQKTKIKDQLINIISSQNPYYNHMLLSDLNLLFNVEQARLTSNTNSQVIKKLEEGRFTGKGVTVIKKYSKLKSKASFAPYIKSFVELKVNPEIEKIQKFWEDFSQIHSDLSLINSISAKKQYCGLYQNDIMKNTFNFFNDQHPIGPFQSYTFGYTSMLEELGAPLICDQVDTTNLISNIKNKLLTLVITQLKNNKQILGNNSSTQLYCQEISKLKLSTEDSYFGPLVKKELERNEYQLSPIAGEGDLNQKNTFKFAYQLCW